MMGQRLAVILYGEHVADRDQNADGQHVLRYRDTSETTPLSLTMPPVTLLLLVDELWPGGWWWHARLPPAGGLGPILHGVVFRRRIDLACPA